MLDLAVVGAYVALMLAVGWRSRRDSPEAYWVAERRSSWGAVAASLVATIFGASSTLGLIGLGYSQGLVGAWWSLTGAVALVPFGLFLAARIRDRGVYTLPDILAGAFGREVALAGAVCIGVAWCGVVAAQMVAAARLLEGTLAWPFGVALLAVSAVFILYTLWGGQISVLRTDAWQLALFAGALLVSFGLVLRALLAQEDPGGRVPSHLWDFPVSRGFGWYQLLVFYPLVVGLPYLVGPDMASRVLCARDGPTARKAALVAAALVAPVALLLAVLGVLLHGLLPGVTPEGALPLALKDLAPPGLRGLLVVGLLAALMSSADTTLMSASSILSLNVLAPLARWPRERAHVWTRRLVLAVGATAWALAAFQKGIIASLLLAYSVFVGGVVLPTLVALAPGGLGLGARAAFAAVVLGGGTALAGVVGGGEGLDALLGPEGTGWALRLLGPEYRRILPLVVSGVVLGGGVVWGRRRAGDRPSP